MRFEVTFRPDEMRHGVSKFPPEFVEASSPREAILQALVDSQHEAWEFHDRPGGFTLQDPEDSNGYYLAVAVEEGERDMTMNDVTDTLYHLDGLANRVVEQHALTCSVPAVREWARRWLSDEDRSTSAAYAAANAALNSGDDAAWYAAHAAWGAAAALEEVVDGMSEVGEEVFANCVDYVAEHAAKADKAAQAAK